MPGLTIPALALLAAAGVGAEEAPAVPPGAGGFHVFPPCIRVRLTAEGVTGRPPISFTWQADSGQVYFGNPVEIETEDYEGFHAITVTATNAWGSGSFTTFLLVEELAVGPAAADQNPTPSLTVTVTGSMTGANEWSWNWGDGTVSPWRCVGDPTFEESHTYAQAGTYLVRLRGRNCRDGTLAGPALAVAVGDPDAIEVEVFAAQGCAAGFCVFDVGEPVVFAQAFSAVPTELRYDWDGDGAVDQVSASPVSIHAYPDPGAFRPRLTAVRGVHQHTLVHAEWLLITGSPSGAIFADGFESGDLSAWSSAAGAVEPGP